MKNIVLAMCLSLLAACSGGGGGSGSGGGTVTKNGDGTCTPRMVEHSNSYIKDCANLLKSETPENLNKLVATCEAFTSTHSESEECALTMSYTSDAQVKRCLGFSESEDMPTGRVSIKAKTVHQVCGKAKEIHTKLIGVSTPEAKMPEATQTEEKQKKVLLKDVDADKLKIKVINSFKAKRLAAREDLVSLDGEIGTLENLGAKVLTSESPQCTLQEEDSTFWSEVTTGQEQDVVDKEEHIPLLKDQKELEIELVKGKVRILCTQKDSRDFTLWDVNQSLKDILVLSEKK